MTVSLIEIFWLLDTQLISLCWQFLQSAHEEQLSGVQMGDPTTSPLSGKIVLTRIHYLSLQSSCRDKIHFSHISGGMHQQDL